MSFKQNISEKLYPTPSLPPALWLEFLTPFPPPAHSLTLTLSGTKEPENATQVSKQRNSIAKLVAWATPPHNGRGCKNSALVMTREDNARASCCLGVVRRRDGFEERETGDRESERGKG